MSNRNPLDVDGEIIVVSPRKPRRRRWWWLLLLAAAAVVFGASRALSIYVSALWFDSLGYSAVYWYMFRLKIELFLIFFLLTIVILRGAFWLIERTFESFVSERRTNMINQ